MKRSALLYLFVGVLFGVLLGSVLLGGGLSGSGSSSSQESAATVVETRASAHLRLERAVPALATAGVRRRLPPRDPFAALHRAPLGRRTHATCAVVGNGGSLLGAGAGAAIDAADRVFRFNWPPLHAYHVDTGLRTDVMLVGASTSLHSRFKPFASYRNFSSDISVISDVHSFDQWRQYEQNFEEPGAPLQQYALSQYFSALAAATVCKSTSSHCDASTGFRGALIALATCDHVDLYGFGAAAGRGYNKYFAKKGRVRREARLYDYKKELDVLKLIAAGKPPPVLRDWTLGSLSIESAHIVHRDTFPKAWSRYVRLTVYNANAMPLSSYEHREPPLVPDATPQIEPVSRVYAHVNEKRPASEYDYRQHKIVFSDIIYAKSAKLGHGTYGDVYRAEEKVKGYTAVLKYLKPQKKRPYIFSREIMILRELGGKRNCIPLLDVTHDESREHIIIVMPAIHIADYRDLYYRFEDIHVRYYTYKLFDGLAYAHSKGILHNDIKPLNLLIDVDTREQWIADWGLGEYYFPQNSPVHNTTLSFHVGTRHWKAPELLLGAHHYSYTVDVWSAGCTFLGMLFHRTHFFPGSDNQHQIVVIAQMLGTNALNRYLDKYQIPVDADWYDRYIGSWGKKSWASQFTAATLKYYSEDAEDLLDHMMVFDPEERYTAAEVTAHKYFDPVRHMTEPPEWPWLADSNQDSF